MSINRRDLNVNLSAERDLNKDAFSACGNSFALLQWLFFPDLKATFSFYKHHCPKIWPIHDMSNYNLDICFSSTPTIKSILFSYVSIEIKCCDKPET